MVQFFGKFGEKPCCITDLKIYLHLLSPDQHVQVRQNSSSLVEFTLWPVKHSSLYHLTVH